MNNDLGLVKKTDDTHVLLALGADKGVCLVDLLDEMGEALL